MHGVRSHPENPGHPEYGDWKSVLWIRKCSTVELYSSLAVALAPVRGCW